MRILHYTLGLPPLRSGGLTKYAMDLMEEQSKENKVIHLYPGSRDLISRRSRIKKNKGIMFNIEHYQLINSLPLPLFNGIKEPHDFMREGPYQEYLSFLEKVRPEIIHIHTLMGLHKEFFEAAKEIGIKLVYTTHDYFGICPTINLYKKNQKMNCLNYEDGKGCLECCYNAFDTKKLLLAQTSLYPTIRKIKLLKPRKHPGTNLDGNKIEITINKEKSVQYVNLREFYFSLLNQIDFFHFNSTVSEQIYRQYLPNIKGKVIDITHKGIKLTRVCKIESKKIRIGYLGPLKEYKGFYLLLEAFNQLNKDKYELHLYGDNTKLETQENVFLHGRYSSEQLESIFSSIDILVVPSIWKETFGFVTLEGLSNGTPVIVSDNVGSKDLVKEEYGWKFNSFSIKELTDLLASLNKDTILEKHMEIIRSFNLQTLQEHSRTLKECIY